MLRRQSSPQESPSVSNPSLKKNVGSAALGEAHTIINIYNNIYRSLSIYIISLTPDLHFLETERNGDAEACFLENQGRSRRPGRGSSLQQGIHQDLPSRILEKMEKIC